jgi:hypothetical protein
MTYLVVFVVANGFVCYGSYRLGRRSDFWSVGLAPLLMLAGWYVLLDLPTIAQKEGAAIGAAVIPVAWYLGPLCVLLALIILGTSIYVRRSILASGILLCVVGPAVLVLGYRLVTDPGAKAAAASPVTAPRNWFLEGYAWAVDNGIDTESKCINGNPAFIDGCKRAVHRR